ncbi:hypothetical protein P1I75_003285 [Escherichia coli]|nr:hypothetical protein [Escherichia coli]
MVQLVDLARRVSFSV